MNVLLAAGPESTRLFIITIKVQRQRPCRSPMRLAGKRRILVPLNRWQGTHRRLLRDGVKILSVAPAEAPGASQPSPLTAPQLETTARPDPQEGLTRSLVDLAVESWCFAWRFERLLLQSEAGEDGRYQGRLSRFRGTLEESLGNAGMKLLDVEGHLFDHEVEAVATASNREDFGADDPLVVDRMSEPVIMGADGMVRKGTVQLKAVEAPEKAVRPTLTEWTAAKAEGLDSHGSKEVLSKALVALAVESWRFGKLFAQLFRKLAAGECSRYQGQLSWFQEKLEEALQDAGMKLVNVEGQPFDPGVAATPLNGDDFAAEDALVVDRMLTPIIMGADGIVRMGTVMLKTAES